MKKHIDNIIQWGKDRDLYNGSDAITQFQKYLGEKGEMVEAVSKNKPDEVKKEIGDVLVCLINVVNFGKFSYSVFNSENNTKNHGNLYHFVMMDDLTLRFYTRVRWGDDINPIVKSIVFHLGAVCDNFDFTIEECMESAFKKIEHRKGKFVNKVYIKEEDLDV